MAVKCVYLFGKINTERFVRLPIKRDVNVCVYVRHKQILYTPLLRSLNVYIHSKYGENRFQSAYNLLPLAINTKSVLSEMLDN